MSLTTTIDSKTGETKTFWLDASFGCRKTEVTCATRTQPVYEVRWSTSVYGSATGSRKFRDREIAAQWYMSKKKKHCRPEWSMHTTGTHEVAA
jgi:hypothetical protein